MKRRTSLVMVLAAMVVGAYGQLIVPGGNDGSPGCGSDGAFNPTSSVQIDLSQAANRAWDQPSPVPGRGVYDNDKWAVVFKYTSVTIPAGVTVTFKNHPSGAPVVWLVGGDVTINGTLSLDGEQYNVPGKLAVAGPGGFRGGRSNVGSTAGSAGFGPGGGLYRDGVGNNGSGGSYGTIGASPGGPYAPVYGNAGVLPLVGGSGGSAAGQSGEFGGSAGGGALLVTCAANLHADGSVRANGGASVWDYYRIAGGGGSGGAIRLVAEAFSGHGTLQATCSGDYRGYPGGTGRIRIEANNVDQFTGSTVPPASGDVPGAVARIFPDDTAPRIYVTQIGGQNVPGDPRPLRYPLHDVQVPVTGQVVAHIEAYNMPLDWLVKVRVVPFSGTDTTYQAAVISGGTVEHSTWEATVNLASGSSSIQVRAAHP